MRLLIAPTTGAVVTQPLPQPVVSDTAMDRSDTTPETKVVRDFVPELTPRICHTGTLPPDHPDHSQR